MHIIRRGPYHLLLLTGIVLVLTSFFVVQKNAVDIHFHDTYFVIAHAHIFWVSAMLALLVWMLCFITAKILYSKWLTWIQVLVTMLALLLFACTVLFGEGASNATPRRYYDFSNWNSYDSLPSVTRVIGMSILAFLFGQVI